MWYVVQVMSGHERKIEELCKAHLLTDKEEVFIPMYNRQKKFKGEWKEVQAILFPGYVFFSTRIVEDLYYRLKNIKELTKILVTGEEFTPLHETEVDFLMQFGGKQHVVEMSIGYIEGDQVIITSGPMKTWKGVVKKIDRHKKIAILEVDLFGRSTEVTVGLEIVEKKPLC